MDTTLPSLLVRLKDRQDAAAWNTFDRIYRPMLHRFALSFGLDHADTEDIVQQCMSAVQERIATFDYDREKGKFKSWLRIMMNNKIRNLLRDRKEQPGDSGDFKDEDRIEWSLNGEEIEDSSLIETEVRVVWTEGSGSNHIAVHTYLESDDSLGL